MKDALGIVSPSTTHSALVVNVHGELQLFEATASGESAAVPLEFYVPRLLELCQR